jgi:hypothetical protein
VRFHNTPDRVVAHGTLGNYADTSPRITDFRSIQSQALCHSNLYRKCCGQLRPAMTSNSSRTLPLRCEISPAEPRAIHLWTNTMIFLTLGLLYAGWWCHKDYRAFLALGPGGPPHNFLGWAAVTFTVRPFALSYEQHLKTTDYPSQGASDLTQSLPRRRGPRARTGGIAPHRQLSQHAPESMRSVSCS